MPRSAALGAFVLVVGLGGCGSQPVTGRGGNASCIGVTPKELRHGLGNRTPAAFGLSPLFQHTPDVRITGVQLVGVKPAGSVRISRAVVIEKRFAERLAPNLPGIMWWSSANNRRWQRLGVRVPSATPLPGPRREWWPIVGLTLRGHGGGAVGVRFTIRSGDDTSAVVLHNHVGIARRNCDRYLRE